MSSQPRQTFLERPPRVPETDIDDLEALIRKKFDLKTGFAEPHQQAATLASTLKGFNLVKNGTVNIDDFMILMQKINCSNDNKHTVQGLFDRYDIKDAGRLEVPTFCNGLFGLKPVPMADAKCRDVIKLCRERILARGGRNGVRSLARILRMMDDNGDRNLDRIEMVEGLAHYGVHLDAAEAASLFKHFDADGSGKISVTEFLVAMRGKMSKQRLEVVQQAFARLDKGGDRTVTLSDLMCIYSVDGHEDVTSGAKSPQEVVAEFAGLWDRDGDSVITEGEFISYYKEVSAGIDDDAFFDLMLRRAWHMSDTKRETWKQAA